METNNLPAFAAALHRAQSVAITGGFVLSFLFGVSGGGTLLLHDQRPSDGINERRSN
jgi:hypothetical protein